jgi:hypothetical protein
MSRRAPVVLAAVLCAVLSPSAAHAAATITSPANGAKARLDKSGEPLFAWTLPPGEVHPEVEVAPQATVANPPSFDLDHNFAPFVAYCNTHSDQNGNFLPAYSCPSSGTAVSGPLAAGRYYAFIWSLAPSDDPQVDYTNEYSAFTTFVIPPFLTWGYNEPENDAPAIDTDVGRTPGVRGPKGILWSSCSAVGWLNEAGRVRFTYTIKQRRRVVKRYRRTERIGADEVGQPDGGAAVESHIVMRPRRHLRPGSRLTCTVTMRGGGITLSRSRRMTAP